MNTSHDSAELLSHVDWVRGLARALIRHTADAEDVSQETLAAAIEAPPDETAAWRAWLRRVMSHVIASRARSEGRRRAREVDAARAEALPSVLDSAARFSMHAAVVTAVERLEEPLRTCVLLRYFEGQPPRAIAAQLGIPVKTVNSRLQRALERLRGTLDDECEGDRRRVDSALLALAGARSVVPSGVRWAVRVALIAFVAIVVAVIARNAARTAAGVAPATEVELANAAPAATASEPLAKLENRRATVAPDSISPKARGRVLDSEEKPVADAVIEFHARASHGLDLNLGGFGADDRVIARVKSDPEGAWIAELPAAGAFELEAHASGFGLVLVEGVAAGDDVAIHMERAALFTLIVKDTHGVPLREAILELRKPGASQPFLCARTDERGSWHFQELPPGPWSIIARSEDRAGQAHIAFGAHAGESLERELVMPGGTALEGTIVRAGDGAALADVELSLGREATTLARSDALGHFRIEGIFEAPGSCDVRAHVRGFRAAIQRVRLEVGKIANVQLALEPGVSATGQVVDERGVAIAQAWVVAWREDASEESSAWDYAEAQSDARGRFQLSDLGADRDYALLVRAPGRASELRAMRCSASEAKIELEPIVVTAGASLAGRVLSADESAYPDAEIVVLRLDGPGSNAGANSPNSTAITIGVNPALDAPRPPELDASRVKSVRTRVRPDGSFRVVDLAPGSYRVTARSIDLRVIDRREITLAPGAALDGMEFRTSEGGSISGRVLDPDRRPLGGAWVLLMKEGRFIETRSAPVDADGRFSFDALEDLRYWVSASYARSGPDGRPEHPFTRCDVHDLGLGAKGVELVLGRTAKLTGRVVDTNGHGLAGAIVDAADETKFHYQAVTDAEGEFTMNVPEASRLALGASWAEHNGGIRVSGRLEDVAAASVDVVIRLE